MKIVPVHGESRSVYHVTDDTAPEGEQPAIHASFPTLLGAENYITYEYLAKQVLDTLYSQRFHDWYENEFSDFVHGENHDTKEIMRQIKKMFFHYEEPTNGG